MFVIDQTSTKKMGNNDEVIKILIIVLGVVVALIFILIIVLVALTIKEKREERKKNRISGNGDEEVDENAGKVRKSDIIYTPESILDFMEFERIEDNMIVQKDGKFLMVVECKGINYDLMSEMEKVSVEQGFFAFLNSLRYPIQLYIQTRTINLEKSIDGYKKKLKEIDRTYNELKSEYEHVLRNRSVTKAEAEKLKHEVVKQKNLEEYTEDIVKDVERQSLNKNILSKKYYVIVPCYSFEIGVGGDYDKSEIENMAFSELYTRARAIINSLFTCQVVGRILNSDELVELLYMAYNRDEADLFWLERIRKAGFEELYSTAPDVLKKKEKLLNKQIEDKAIKLANKKINEARRDREIELMEKEENEEEYVNKKAIELIKKHKRFIGEDVANKAVYKVAESSKENKEIVLQKEKKEELRDGVIQEKGKKGSTGNL